MVNVELLQVCGQTIQGISIKEPGGEGHPDMLILLCKKGYIMCGYLNEGTAEKFGDAAAIISGSNFEEVLENPVKAVTPEAEKLGIVVGMKGTEAVMKLNQ